MCIRDRAGAALLLALAGSPLLVPAAQAATITVADGEIAFNAGNGDCSLIEAINNANNNNDTSGGDCAAGGVGADTVALPAGGTFDFTAPAGDYDGNTGLPQITSAITLSGLSLIHIWWRVALAERLATRYPLLATLQR